MTQSLEKMLEASLPELRAFVRKNLGRLRRKESPSEIVQLTCRTVLEHPQWFRTRDLTRFRAWLVLTARREILNRVQYWRAAKRGANREATMDAGNVPPLPIQPTEREASTSAPTSSLERQEAAERLWTELERLPRDYRTVIVLSRIEGFSRAEVAQRMNRSEASVRNLLARALIKLSASLGKNRS